MWHNVSLKLEYAKTRKEPVYTRINQFYSTQKVMNYMQVDFPSAYAARQAYEDRSDGKWAAFEARVNQMYEREGRMGIEHPRMVGVDFHGVQPTLEDRLREPEREVQGLDFPEVERDEIER